VIGKTELILFLDIDIDSNSSSVYLSETEYLSEDSLNSLLLDVFFAATLTGLLVAAAGAARPFFLAS